MQGGGQQRGLRDGGCRARGRPRALGYDYEHLLAFLKPLKGPFSEA